MKGDLLGRKRGNGRLINLESAVSTSKTCEIWHSTRGARNPVRSRRWTLQNVHTHVKLCPPPGRKRVVSYHHSQGTTKLQGQGPGTGGETAVRACSVGNGCLCILPPGCGGRQTTPRLPRVENRRHKKAARSWYQLRAVLSHRVRAAGAKKWETGFPRGHVPRGKHSSGPKCGDSRQGRLSLRAGDCNSLPQSGFAALWKKR